MGEGQKNVPKLRFKGYEDAWEQRKLGEFCDMFNGDRSSKYPNASDMLPEGIPFINAGDLQEGRVNLETCNKISKSKYDELSGAKLSEGDIVYCLRGSLGKNAYIDNFSEGTIASSLVAIRPKMINGRFLFHILNSDIEYKQRVLRDEGAAQPNLSAKSLSEFFIPIPEAEEDQSVADFLDNVDNYITLHQRKYYALKSMKKTLLSKMFPKNGEDVPEIRFKGFTDAWEQRKLGEVAPIRGGFAFKSELFRVEGIPIVRISNIMSNGTVGGDFVFYDEQTLEENILLQNGSIVIAMSGATTGKVAKLSLEPDKKLYQNQRVGYFLPTNAVDYNFIFSLVNSNSFRTQLNEIIIAGAQPNISSKDIDTFTFSFPELVKEQASIGLFLIEVDNLITLHQRKLDELKNMKKTLLQQMFV